MRLDAFPSKFNPCDLLQFLAALKTSGKQSDHDSSTARTAYHCIRTSTRAIVTRCIYIVQMMPAGGGEVARGRENAKNSPRHRVVRGGNRLYSKVNFGQWFPLSLLWCSILYHER